MVAWSFEDPAAATGSEAEVMILIVVKVFPHQYLPLGDKTEEHAVGGM